MSDLETSNLCKIELGQDEWHLKACQLLEKQISEIKEENARLAMDALILTSCLNDHIEEIYQLKFGPSCAPLNEAMLKQYLFEFSKPSSSLFNDDLIINSQIHFPKIKSKPVRSKQLPNDDLISQDEEPAKTNSVLIKTDVGEVSSSSHDLVVGSDLEAMTGNAFRLFAKHIGSSLKREYRMQFNSLPTQSWLANQLLAKWDQLNSHEKQFWCKRAKSSVV